MTRKPQHYHLCPLCGFEFERSDTDCASKCPMGRFCNLIRCPNCAYEFPQEPQFLGWIHRLFHRDAARPPKRDTVALHELEEGEHVELVCLNCAHHARRNALAVFGLVPGCRLVLEQKRPAFVIRIGETELALDADIAREVFVKRLPRDQAAPAPDAVTQP